MLMSKLDNPGLGGVPKVSIVSPRLDIGGTEKHISRILPELRRRGIDVSLFLLERGGRLESTLAASGVPIFGPTVTTGSLYQSIRCAWHLVCHLRKHRPDIVHFFLAEPYLIGSLASMLTGVKVRIMSRRSLANYQAQHLLLAPFERWLHRYTLVLLGNSKAVVDELAQECGNRAKIGLIYNGIESSPAISDATRAKFRRDLGLSDDSFVLTIVANLIEYKGHEDLLQALGLAHERLPPDWRLLIVGRDDGAGASLKTKAVALGLADHIRWLGECQDIDRFLNAADVAVLCSHEEGFSNSLIETMGRGLPAIATAVGGNIDAVIHGETGLLVPVRDPAALAEAILRMAGSLELRSNLGAAARRRVEQLFTLDGCVRRYLNLYKGIAETSYRTVQSIIDQPAGTAIDESLPPQVTVTVVIPVHNRSDILPRTLSSVGRQTFPKVEVVIVDDGSTEDITPAISDFHRFPLRVVRHQTQRGPAAARNSGIASARGSFIAFLDSDDEWLPTKIEQQVEFMVENDCQVSGTDFLIIKEGSEVITRSPHAPNPEFLFGCTISPGSTMMVTRHCLDRVGMFSEDLYRLEDWDWLLRCRRQFRVSILPTPLARIHSSPKTANPALVLHALETIDRRSGQYNISTLGLSKFKSTILLEKAAIYYRNGNIARAIAYGLLSFTAYPFRNKPFFEKIFSTGTTLMRRYF